MFNSLSYQTKAWLLLAFAFFIITLLNLWHPYTILFAYGWGSSGWLNHESIYNGTGYGFIYLPQTAIFFIPFFLLPVPFGYILWNGLWMFFLGMSFLKLTRYSAVAFYERFFLFLIAVTLCMGIDTFRNGQLNIAILILSLLALIAVYEKKNGLAAIYLALGLGFKPTFIVMLLLCFGLFPSVRIKLIFALVGLFLFPFLFADFHYVVAQYVGAIHNFKMAFNYGAMNWHHSLNEWAQMFNLLELMGLKYSMFSQFLIRIFLAGVTFWIALKGQKRKVKNYQKIIFIYTLSVVYLLLFNPRTENNDYILLAPALAALGYQEIFVEKRKIQALILGVLFIMFIFKRDLSTLILPHYKTWLAPALTCFFLLIVLKRFFSEKESHLFRLARH